MKKSLIAVAVAMYMLIGMPAFAVDSPVSDPPGLEVVMSHDTAGAASPDSAAAVVKHSLGDTYEADGLADSMPFGGEAACIHGHDAHAVHGDSIAAKGDGEDQDWPMAARLNPEVVSWPALE